MKSFSIVNKRNLTLSTTFLLVLVFSTASIVSAGTWYYYYPAYTDADSDINFLGMASFSASADKSTGKMTLNGYAWHGGANGWAEMVLEFLAPQDASVVWIQVKETIKYYIRSTSPGYAARILNSVELEWYSGPIYGWVTIWSKTYFDETANYGQSKSKNGAYSYYHNTGESFVEDHAYRVTIRFKGWVTAFWTGFSEIKKDQGPFAPAECTVTRIAFYCN